MQTPSRGFTLIETVVAAGILVAAAVAVASLFVNSIKVGVGNRERTNAALVLSTKMEELKVSSLPNGEYSDSVTLPDGSTLQREWSISGSPTRTIVVIVYSRRHTELVRATTMSSPSW